MNNKQVERQLRELVRRKPRINQPGRLVAHLLNELKIESDQQRRHAALIEKTLNKFADEKLIKLHHSGSVLNGYTAIKKPPKPANPRKAPGQPEATTAVPSKVTVETQREERLPRHEMVTLALNALQERADEEGHLYVRSAIDVIAQELDIPKHEAADLNSVLYDLGLRTSPRGRNDSGNRPHWVETKVGEVTKEQLTTPPAPSTPATEEYAEQKLLSIIQELESKVSELRGSADAAEKLTQVVGELEKKVADSERAMKEATEALARKNSEVAQLTKELRDTRSQLLARAAPSPAVADVLRRYGKA